MIVHIGKLTKLVVNSCRFSGFKTYVIRESSAWQIGLSYTKQWQENQIPNNACFVDEDDIFCIVWLMEQQQLNLQSHLQRILEMYIAVEPFVYDKKPSKIHKQCTSSFKKIYIHTRTHTHTHTHTQMCTLHAFTRNMSVYFRRRSLNSRIHN
jgi:hypothetical protein